MSLGMESNSLTLDLCKGFLSVVTNTGDSALTGSRAPSSPKQRVNVAGRFRGPASWVPVNRESTYIYPASVDPHGRWWTEPPLWKELKVISCQFSGVNRKAWASPFFYFLEHLLLETSYQGRSAAVLRPPRCEKKCWSHENNVLEDEVPQGQKEWPKRLTIASCGEEVTFEMSPPFPITPANTTQVTDKPLSTCILLTFLTPQNYKDNKVILLSH